MPSPKPSIAKSPHRIWQSKWPRSSLNTASLSPQLSDTLSYFSRFNYPLTPDELWYWQHHTKISKFQIRNLNLNFKLQIPNWKTRKHRESFSKKKWLIATEAGGMLQRIPLIQAIFVTGSLAMNNCPKFDDIDLMIVTSPHTLWLTRLLVIFTLGHNRRPSQLPEHSSPRVSNKICDNLYLDTNNLQLTTHNLYLAHEILQAKCLFDRGGIHHRFLTQNSWVKSYLPIAYKMQISNLKNQKHMLKSQNNIFINYTFAFSNLIFYLAQLLYMRSKITTERVGPGFAFFHPGKST